MDQDTKPKGLSLGPHMKELRGGLYGEYMQESLLKPNPFECMLKIDYTPLTRYQKLKRKISRFKYRLSRAWDAFMERDEYD